MLWLCGSFIVAPFQMLFAPWWFDLLVTLVLPLGALFGSAWLLRRGRADTPGVERRRV